MHDHFYLGFNQWIHHTTVNVESWEGSITHDVKYKELTSHSLSLSLSPYTNQILILHAAFFPLTLGEGKGSGN